MRRARMCAAALALGALGIIGALGIVAHAGTVVPKRLAIYYGDPSQVEEADGSVAHAVRVFSDYDVIVFGDGPELGGAPGDQAGPDAPLLGQIIARLHIRPRRP